MSRMRRGSDPESPECQRSEYPKYWDKEEQTVVRGIEVREGKTNIKDILGTWHFFFFFHPEFEEALDDITGNLHIDIPEDGTDPVDMTGRIQIFDNEPFSFKGLARRTDARQYYPKNSAFEILSMEENDMEWYETANTIYLTKEKDVDGNPFLVLDWNQGPGGWGVWTGFCIASRKKLPGREAWEALSIGFTDRTVKKNAKEKSRDEEKKIEATADRNDNEPVVHTESNTNLKQNDAAPELASAAGKRKGSTSSRGMDASVTHEVVRGEGQGQGGKRRKTSGRA